MSYTTGIETYKRGGNRGKFKCSVCKKPISDYSKYGLCSKCYTKEYNRVHGKTTKKRI